MSNDIRYVILSDLHLGQDESLLTNLTDLRVDPTKPSPVLEHMVACLRALIGHNQSDEPPTLILLGDAFELALSEMHVSVTAFQRFAELLHDGDEPLFGKLIFAPGNHDHHLWAQARESAYRAYLESAPASLPLEPIRHTSALTAGIRGGDGFLRAVLRRALGAGADDIATEVYYPALALRSPTGDRVALLDHGHYFESLYHLMNTLGGLLFPDAPKPATLAELERENFAWIDFFWSAMGRQGLVGAEVERVYDNLAFPDREKRMVNGLVEHVIAGWDVNFVEKKAARLVLEWAIGRYIDKAASAERSHHPVVLSDGLAKGMAAYVSGPLLTQAEAELGRLPSDVTLVFGHTHKPFEDVRELPRIAKPVKIYNTGGWVVDPGQHPQPLHGGAAVVMNEQLDAASVRFYNEQKNGGVHAMRVAHAGEASEFATHIAGLVTASGEPYRGFSVGLAGEVAVRMQVVERVLEGGDTGTQ